MLSEPGPSKMPQVTFTLEGILRVRNNLVSQAQDLEAYITNYVAVYSPQMIL